MRKIRQDIIEIEKEIEKVKNRDDLEIETFHKIIKRRKEIWNAYFLDCLQKEKATFEYINQQIDEDVRINFQKLIRKVNSLNNQIEELEIGRKKLVTPMEFDKLVEWTRDEDVISDLFIMPVKISDIKTLLREARKR